MQPKHWLVLQCFSNTLGNLPRAKCTLHDTACHGLGTTYIFPFHEKPHIFISAVIYIYICIDFYECNIYIYIYFSYIHVHNENPLVQPGPTVLSGSQPQPVLQPLRSHVSRSHKTTGSWAKRTPRSRWTCLPTKRTWSPSNGWNLIDRFIAIPGLMFSAWGHHTFSWTSEYQRWGDTILADNISKDSWKQF